jgi:DNA helicase-2/ATP-dependent DNA helicase PcrA
MVGLEDGLLPHAWAQDERRDIEEERRLCFVGLTRARERLTLTFARYRMHHGQQRRQTPSPFVREIGGGSGLARSSLVSQELVFESAGPDNEDGRDTVQSLTGWRNRRSRDAGGAGQEEADEDAAIRAAARPEGGLYRLGLLVRHRTYGLGTIVDVFGSGEEAKVCIRFPTVGEKTFVAGFARLEIIERK